MSPGGEHVGRLAAELRRDFDASFAIAPAEDRAVRVDFLSLIVGGERHAVRLAEVSGLFVGRAVTPLPCAAPGLLGIAGIGGALVPVYDLGVLLGGAPVQSPRRVLVAAGAAVALAFDEFEGHLRVGRDAIAREDGGEASRTQAREVLRVEGRLLPILQLSSVIRGIEDRARQGAPRKEM